MPDRKKGAGRLRWAGFSAVANGYENGRHSAEWVIAHIEKSIPKRNEEGVRRAERALVHFRALANAKSEQERPMPEIDNRIVRAATIAVCSICGGRECQEVCPGRDRSYGPCLMEDEVSLEAAYPAIRAAVVAEVVTTLRGAEHHDEWAGGLRIAADFIERTFALNQTQEPT